jgi:hypothetical protein
MAPPGIPRHPAAGLPFGGLLAAPCAGAIANIHRDTDSVIAAMAILIGLIALLLSIVNPIR